MLRYNTRQYTKYWLCFVPRTAKIRHVEILRPKTSRILWDFGCEGVRKADACKRRQTQKHRNYAVLGRFGLLVFAYINILIATTPAPKAKTARAQTASRAPIVNFFIRPRPSAPL